MLKITLCGLVPLLLACAANAQTHTSLAFTGLSGGMNSFTAYSAGDNSSGLASFYNANVDPNWAGTVNYKVAWNGDGGSYTTDTPFVIGDASNIWISDTDSSIGFDNTLGAGVTTAKMGFSGLANGYLPAGTLIAFSDVEGSTDRLTSDSTSPWLTVVGTGDHNLPIDPAIDVPTLIWSPLVQRYELKGAANSGQNNFIVAETTKPINSLSLQSNHDDEGSYGMLIYAPVVPEPSSSFLVVVCSSILLLRRRRK